MRLLLDTHIALWAILDSPKLPAAARKLILAPRNEICVSAASLLEIALDRAYPRKKRGAIQISADGALEAFLQSGYSLISITPVHAAALEALPNHHTDPFDRLLVAQALTEPLRLLTHDETLGFYSDTVIVV